MSYIIVVILILFSAVFSGLTLGLMGLSAPELKRKMTLGNKDAAKVYTVRRRGNLLLTTLLIGNVAINTALSIFLGSIASGFTAGLIATGLIVVFGEIMPQAIFSRFALSLGARMAWLVRIFIFVLYPISWPIAWILNKTLGEEMATIYSKKELMKIVEEHEGAQDSDIDAEEERIVRGALSFSDKSVRDVMTPRSIIKSLEFSEVINVTVIDGLVNSGHSRFPVFKKDESVVGILYLRQLLESETIGKVVGDVADKKVMFVSESEKLDRVFRAFLRSKHHMFIAHDEFGAMSGLITLENILEEIINDEIVDESDIHSNLREVAKKNNKIKDVLS